jgi:DNA-binding CsgD family transcriptional regulator
MAGHEALMIAHRGERTRVAWAVPLIDQAEGATREDRLDPSRTDSRFLDGLAVALDLLDQSIILVDQDASVLFANAAAHDLLADSKALSLSGGRLKAQTSTATTMLKDVIFRCASAASGLPDRKPLLHCRVGDPPLFILAARADGLRSNSASRGIVYLFITDPACAPVPCAEYLRQQFGLTRTEALLAVDVLLGEGLGASAGRLGISIQTARTHLRSIFGKTGARRQAELVRLLFSARPAVRHPLLCKGPAKPKRD